MTHASDDNDIRLASLGVLDKFSAFTTWISAGLKAARSALHKAEAAHVSRRKLASYSEADHQDTGIDPSDATGVGSWQPDLPFFMQNGFGRR